MIKQLNSEPVEIQWSNSKPSASYPLNHKRSRDILVPHKNMLTCGPRILWYLMYTYASFYSKPFLVQKFSVQRCKNFAALLWHSCFTKQIKAESLAWRPQKTTPIFLSAIGSPRSCSQGIKKDWQSRSAQTINEPKQNKNRNQGRPDRLQRENNSCLCGYNVQKRCMNFGEVPWDHLPKLTVSAQWGRAEEHKP